MYVHKVRCPRHFMLIPGKKPYLMKVNPMYAKLPSWAFKKFNIDREITVKDKYGRPVPDYRNYHQPLISAADVIEKTYDPLNPICKNQCRKICFEGMGIVNTRSIRRLNG